MTEPRGFLLSRRPAITAPSWFPRLTQMHSYRYIACGIIQWLRLPSLLALLCKLDVWKFGEGYDEQ